MDKILERFFARVLLSLNKSLSSKPQLLPYMRETIFRETREGLEKITEEEINEFLDRIES